MDNQTITVQTFGGQAVDNEPPSESPFSCNICKKSYTRIDHLARHFRSHSRERPFVCQTCGKSFARIDLLKRHTANHDGNEADANGLESATKRRRTSPKPHRPRTQQACRSCAESKLRCDGDRPCLRCQQRSLTCEYAQQRAPGNSENQSLDLRDDSNRLASEAPPQPVETSNPVVAPVSERTMHDDQPSRNMPPRTIEFQLPTPTSFDQVVPPPDYGDDLMVNFDDFQTMDALRDAQSMVDQLVGFQDLIGHGDFPKDVLDFGVDLTFDTPSIFNTDFLLPLEQPSIQSHILPSYTDPVVTRSGMVTPGLKNNVNILASAQAFKESLWLWTPEKDDHGALEQYNLSLPLDAIAAEGQPDTDFPSLHQRMSNMARGKILAMVLKTCEPVMHSHVISNFPAADLMTTLVHNFVSFHSQQEIVWIHPSTIDIEKECPEFLATIITYGAVVSHLPEVRKLGFALHEALRLAHSSEFERDNRATRELRNLQAFALNLDIGLWSGDRRKMEIGESFAMPLLTMIRRAGHYRYSRIIELPPQSEDVGEALEAKWRSWVRRESFKRLALYAFYRDVRSSMSLLSQPLVSHAEVATALPCRKELWLAKTATDWKTAYLTQLGDQSKLQPSIRTCVETGVMFDHHQIVDIDLSLLLLIATVWPLIWQYREMKTAVKFKANSETRHSNLTMDSRHHEVEQILRHIQLDSMEWLGSMKPAAWLLHEQCMIHLYVSLEDVQLLAGKEGEEEARRIYPTMSTWAESTEARQALFHAGQVIRAARHYQKLSLRDSAAVAVYHASLVFWAYAVLSKNPTSNTNQPSPLNPTTLRSGNSVRLDGEDGPEVQRYILLGRGIPCIERTGEASDNNAAALEVPLKEPAEVMNAIAKLLQRHHSHGEKSCPPLLENLSKLMQALGKAALNRRQK